MKKWRFLSAPLSHLAPHHSFSFVLLRLILALSLVFVLSLSFLQKVFLDATHAKT